MNGYEMCHSSITLLCNVFLSHVDMTKTLLGLYGQGIVSYDALEKKRK